MQAKTEQQEPFSLEVVWTALRCWWMVAGPIAVCLACAAGYGVYVLTPPSYTGTLWLEIGAPVTYLGNESAEESNRFVNNQLELIKKPSVLQAVAADSKVASTPELVREANPIAALRKQLKVRRQGKSDFHVVEFTSTLPDRAALIPNKVAECYKKELDDELEKQRELIIESLEQRLEELKNDLQSDRAKIKAQAEKVGAKDPYGVVQKADSPTRTLAGELNAQLAKAEVDHEFLVAEVDAEISVLKGQSTDAPQEWLDARIDRDPRLLALISKGEELEKSHLELAEAVTNPEKNKKVQSRRNDIAKNKADIDKMRNTIHKELKGDLESRAKMNLNGQIADLEKRKKRSLHAVESLRARRDEEMHNQGTFSGQSYDLEFMKNDYERAVNVSAMVSDRLSRLKIEPHGSDRVRVKEPALTPKLPDQEVPYKKILMAMVGAFAIPFGCAVAYEILHQRVNCRKQLESLDVPCTVTEIAALPSRSRALLSGRREDRLDLFIESVDGLRTSLMVPSGRKEVRVFAVTSAIPGEGKTSLSTQFALSLASATGEPTLLIDGDLRYPDLHNAFELELSPGLADVFDNTCPASEAIVKARGDNLFVLPAGELTGNPHRVTANGRFRELIGELRTHFKYIVIDTPPILPASEALVMAKAADATLLVARRDHSRLSLVKEASQKIVNSGSKFAGVVLSGVPSRDYQYRYGAYGYGNGRHS